MVITRFALIVLLACNTNLLANCILSSDCNDGEVCVSYTSCDLQKNKQQVRMCLARSCYSAGNNCPDSIYCNNKHCSDLRCAKQ
jgi:hypothetical protein